MKRISLLTLCIFTLPQIAAAYDDKTITVENAPISIKDFRATYNAGSGSYPRPTVVYRLEVKNEVQKKIVAYQIGFMAFDAFKERLGRGLQGYSVADLPAGESKRAGWEHSVLEAGLFEDYGMGIAYPYKVRFDDGSIWEADMSDVLDQLREIESDLSLDDLQPKKE